MVARVSVLIVHSSERGIDVSPDGYALCCGLVPTVYRWSRKQAIAVMCANPTCENHRGVLAGEVDIHEKWEKWRVK
jgi:hypothetical protein